MAEKLVEFLSVQNLQLKVIFSVMYRLTLTKVELSFSLMLASLVISEAYGLV